MHCACIQMTHVTPYNVIKCILDSSDPKHKHKGNDGGRSTDGGDRRDCSHHLRDQLDQDEDQEVCVGHSSELLEEIEGDEGDEVVLGCLHMVVLKEVRQGVVTSFHDTDSIAFCVCVSMRTFVSVHASVHAIHRTHCILELGVIS